MIQTGGEKTPNFNFLKPGGRGVERKKTTEKTMVLTPPLLLRQRREEHRDRHKLSGERDCRIATPLLQPAMGEQASENRLYFHINSRLAYICLSVIPSFLAAAVAFVPFSRGSRKRRQ